MIHLITAYLLIAQVRSFTQLNEAAGDWLAWQVVLLKFALLVGAASGFFWLVRKCQRKP